jgi:hypothetical protein
MTPIPLNDLAEIDARPHSAPVATECNAAADFAQEPGISVVSGDAL